jgi:prepilin-type N-terminal cleavage/methylation domain-containing protein
MAMRKEVSSVRKIAQGRQAFTLVEIMLVLALIGLLAALAVPTFIQARKQSQGKRVVNDARIIDAAIDSWAFEKAKKNGDAINAGDLMEISSYAKGGSIPTNDVLSNPYTIGPVGPAQVLIAPETKAALTGVAIDWGSY